MGHFGCIGFNFDPDVTENINFIIRIEFSEYWGRKSKSKQTSISLYVMKVKIVTNNVSKVLEKVSMVPKQTCTLF